ncbi:Alkyl hydroperoxide reductase subunit F [Microbacterium sp. Bi98]|uniref:NAD(P)/FAD-dependent oxidoreductase n=1 Tax=unclassified Microbacterium TaxID=2609290 RepID=UPI0006F6C342|nr:MULTISPECIES: NAD(P)/FAD-dependent oxidoreductase [unclassified Microbacterium]KRD54409.1 thioredoxin reductase [Microbacterium sp. Root280D1]CAH0207948.1 Alkyl hydroperoxide reductase subunit F [Microbacterium sp. Bi98]
MYDAIVIGAGPAGLQAALTLGRMHRPTLLLDSGEYRNGTVLHMHNVIANDGTPPAEFRATARAQLAEYSDIDVRDVGAQTVTGSEGSFVVRLADGETVETRHVILATGVADDLPDIPGLQDLWGTKAFSCPFCDGHEHAGRSIGILGPAPRAEHLIGLLGRIVGDITVFPVEQPFAADETRTLEGLGVRVSAEPVAAVAPEAADVRITTASTAHTVVGVFVASGSLRHRAPFADQLGLELLPSGSIEIDDLGRTSQPGVFAAGDLAHRASLPGPMASVLLASAAGQMAAVGVIQSLMAH